MKYIYKKTGTMVESGHELNPALFQPVAEVKKEIGTTEAEALVEVPEQKETDALTETAEQKEAKTSAETAEQDASDEKNPAKASAVKKKTTVRRTTSTKK